MARVEGYLAREHGADVFRTRRAPPDVLFADDADLDAALVLVGRCMTPAPDLRLKGWLARLQAGCATRPGSEASAAVQLKLYTDELAKYPADVAKAACDQLLRGSGGTVWFPTLGELIDACDALVADRRDILRSLEARQAFA